MLLNRMGFIPALVTYLATWQVTSGSVSSSTKWSHFFFGIESSVWHLLNLTPLAPYMDDQSLALTLQVIHSMTSLSSGSLGTSVCSVRGRLDEMSSELLFSSDTDFRKFELVHKGPQRLCQQKRPVLVNGSKPYLSLGDTSQCGRQFAVLGPRVKGPLVSLWEHIWQLKQKL